VTTPPAGRRTIVVPCFNEEQRLSHDGVRELASGAAVLLVDSGSSDGTAGLVAALAAELETVTTLSLATNAGKGEAVRRGLLAAMEDGPDLVAYFDADFATPAAEMLRLLDVLAARPELTVLMGSRVALLGREIVRSPARHYLGRVYATGASLALDLPVYDTQCGAKALRPTPALRAALAQPFRARWAFDVELLGRLLRGDPPVPVEEIAEEPLLAWHDVAGTRLGLKEMLRASAELARLAPRLRRPATPRPRA